MRTQFFHERSGENDGVVSTEDDTTDVTIHKPSGHGPTDLIGGDDQWGFYGEVTSNDFITGDALASAIGLSAGHSQHSTTEWLKFNSDGKIVLIPKKPLRYDLTWEHIYQVGAVYGDDTVGNNPSGSVRLQDTTVTIDGFDYRVTLMKGSVSDPTIQNLDGEWIGHSVGITHGSEWNHLMYPIHSGTHTDDRNPVTHTDLNAAPFGSWASYTDADLIVDHRSGHGSRQWVQETNGDNTSYRVGRGSVGIAGIFNDPVTYTSTFLGWRPRLELIT